MLNPAKGMRLDEDTAFRYVMQLAEAVERVGGVLTLLWHPNAVINPSWWRVYLRSLEYLKEKNAFFGAVSSIIGNFFKCDFGAHIHHSKPKG